MNTSELNYYDSIMGLDHVHKTVLNVLSLSSFSPKSLDQSQMDELMGCLINIISNMAVIFNDDLPAFLVEYCALRDDISDCKDYDAAIEMLKNWTIGEENELYKEMDQRVVQRHEQLKNNNVIDISFRRQ